MKKLQTYYPLICSNCGRKCGLIYEPRDFICTICLTNIEILRMGISETTESRISKEIHLAELQTNFKHNELDTYENQHFYGALPNINYWVKQLKHNLTNRT